MIRKCVEPGAGELLHAYELGMLSDEETTRFEQHLLVCTHCYAAVETFEPFSRRIREDPLVRSEIQEVAGRELLPGTGGRWALLWPEGPFWRKPALWFVLTVLLAIPAVRGIRPRPENQVRILQSLTLAPVRSGNGGTFSAGKGLDGVISFVYPGGAPGGICLVTCRDDQGRTLLIDSNFTAFDEIGAGYLIFPAEKMTPGRYTLTISDPRQPAIESTYQYRFDIRP